MRIRFVLALAIVIGAVTYYEMSTMDADCKAGNPAKCIGDL